jgi:nucleoside-diphosphate-sugar epimerase
MAELAQTGDFYPVGICRRPEAASELLAAGLEAHSAGLASPETLRLLAACDVVVNCIRPHGRVPEVRRVEAAVLRLLGALPRHLPLIQFSSVSVYSEYYTDAEKEWRSPTPTSFLGKNKLWLEQRLRSLIRAESRPWLIVRLGHVFGAGSHRSKTIAAAHRVEGYALPPGDVSISDAIHIRSVAAATTTTLRSGPRTGVYNLVPVSQWTWREVFDWHAQAMGWPPVQDLDAEQAREQAQRLRHRLTVSLGARLLSEFSAWVVSPRQSSLSACPSVRDAVRWSVRTLGSDALEERLLTRIHGALTEPAKSKSSTELTCDRWLFGQGAPGPVLKCAYSPGQPDQLELRRWLESISLAPSGSGSRSRTCRTG